MLTLPSSIPKCIFGCKENECKSGSNPAEWEDYWPLQKEEGWVWKDYWRKWALKVQEAKLVCGKKKFWFVEFSGSLLRKWMEQDWDRNVTLASKRKVRVHRKWEWKKLFGWPACNVQQQGIPEKTKVLQEDLISPNCIKKCKLQSIFSWLRALGSNAGKGKLLLHNSNLPPTSQDSILEPFMDGINFFLFLACDKKERQIIVLCSIQILLNIYDLFSFSGDNLF